MPSQINIKPYTKIPIYLSAFHPEHPAWLSTKITTHTKRHKTQVEETVSIRTRLGYGRDVGMIRLGIADSQYSKGSEGKSGQYI